MKKKSHKISKNSNVKNITTRANRKSSIKSSSQKHSNVTASLNNSIKTRLKNQQINLINKSDTAIKSEEVHKISEAITKKYDFSELSRGDRLYVQFNRCGICLNYASLSYPANIIFCCNCEAVVHLSCLNIIPKLDKSKLNISKCKPSSYKGRYIATVKFENQFTCEKCTDSQAK